MNTIVCNTRNGAVSEYADFDFQSVTPTHAGSALGLFKFGGGKDVLAPIVAQIRLPLTLRESTLKKFPRQAYVSIKGSGSARFTVYGPDKNWDYAFGLRCSGETRCVVGRGIRENYVGFGIAMPYGQPFELDRVEVDLVTSVSRRI